MGVLFVPDEEWESGRPTDDIAGVDIDRFCCMSCPEFPTWLVDDSRAVCKTAAPDISAGNSKFFVLEPLLVDGFPALRDNCGRPVSFCFGGTLCDRDCICCSEVETKGEFIVIIFPGRTASVEVGGTCNSSGGGFRVIDLACELDIPPWVMTREPIPETDESSSRSSSSDVCPEGERNPEEGVMTP